MTNYPFQKTVDPVVLLTSLARRKVLFRMSHPFHGVVLTEDLTLVSLKPDCAQVKLGHHWLPAHLGDCIYLHTPDSDDVLAARVQAINMQSGELSLGDFSVIGRSWADRGHDRVQPRQPVHALLRVDERAFTATLEDFSVNGAGVLAYKLREHGFNLSPGQSLKLEFELPQTRTRIALPARLANIRYHGGHLTCIGINTYPNLNQARALERYINLRKAEIMDELDRVLNETLQPQSVMALYF